VSQACTKSNLQILVLHVLKFAFVTVLKLSNLILFYLVGCNILQDSLNLIFKIFPLISGDRFFFSCQNIMGNNEMKKVVKSLHEYQNA